MFPVVDDVVPSFSPLRDSSGILAPNKHLARLLSLFFLYAPSPPVSVYSDDSPPVSDPPHRPSPIVRPSESYQPSGFGRPMPSSGFPTQRPICRFASPPQPVRLVVLGLGVGGGAKESAPPAVALSLLIIGWCSSIPEHRLR